MLYFCRDEKIHEAVIGLKHPVPAWATAQKIIFSICGIARNNNWVKKTTCSAHVSQQDKTVSSSSTLGSFFCFVTRTNICWLDRVLSTSLRSKVGLNIRDRRSVIPTSWDRNDFPRTWQTGMRRQKKPAFCFTKNYVIVEFCLQFSIREI